MNHRYCLLLGLLLASTPLLASALDKTKCDKALTNFEKLAGLAKTQKEVDSCAAGKGGYTDKALDCMMAAKTEKEISVCVADE